MHSIDLYDETAKSVSLDQFVNDHKTLVKKIALYIKRRLPSHVGLDDLMQSGFVGLLEAHKNYKDDMGASFETYAGVRIRGAIIDALRKNSWGTRESSKNMRRISEAITKIEQRGQKHPSTEDIIAELGISLDEHAEMCKHIIVSNVISLDLVDQDNSLLGDAALDPQVINQQEDLKQFIKDILIELPQREQLVLSLYYLDEFTFKQIGEILDLTEARICQLHSQAIARVQAKIRTKKMGESE